MPFHVPNGGVEVGALGFGLEILILPRGFPGPLLAFFWCLRSMGAFRLLARVREVMASDPVEGP
jgi:hypothetical protein